MTTTHHRVRSTATGVVLALALIFPLGVTARSSGDWSTAVPVTSINSPQADGCPIESADGLSLYFASTRPGAVGGATDPNDIWVARRATKRAPWRAPVHLPEPVNSSAADFCPTPVGRHQLYFVSTRSIAGACGAGDIYRTRKGRAGAWAAPLNLGCQATGAGPNFAGGEFSPSILTARSATWLYFSSTGRDGLDQDIYVSRRQRDGTFGSPRLVKELSTAANDQMPNVRRDGLEIVFVSDRPGGVGGTDVYVATRRSIFRAWSAPRLLGPEVNTEAGESRPSLSADGRRLHFGRSGDIWMSERDRPGKHGRHG